MKLRSLAEVAFAAALAASNHGCGKPVLRVADASIGDYYSEKEFKKLRKEQRDEYCAELARQDSIYKQELLSLSEELDQSKARSRRLREEGDSLFALGTTLESQIAEGGGGTGLRPKPDGQPASIHVVRPGESLWGISAAPQIYGRGSRWLKLYAANRSRIRDPNLIYPGQELSIPR